MKGRKVRKKVFLFGEESRPPLKVLRAGPLHGAGAGLSRAPHRRRHETIFCQMEREEREKEREEATLESKSRNRESGKIDLALIKVILHDFFSNMHYGYLPDKTF